MPAVLGIHHVTAIGTDPQRKIDFYTEVLGLRLVKKTVNFDDPGTYHLYFGDAVGTPGTILTFFPSPGARRGSRGQLLKPCGVFLRNYVRRGHIRRGHSRCRPVMLPVPWIYRPLEQAPVRRVFLALRTAGEPHELTAPLQAAIWKIDPDQPIDSILTLREFIDMTLAGPAYVGSLLYQLGFLALGLALMGIYGLVAFSVTQQTREIGIRMALGEQSRSVLRRVPRDGAKLAGLGMLIGLPLALGLLRMLGAAMSALNANAAMRPLPMVMTVIMLAGAATIACYLPARRATRVDPLVALQEE